ncbi:hypothetical protein [Actinacidiphila rubida]|uniref:DUF4232 domain-containing protein n=1 Tax=Actinacidiphila rubida TaxID=310780 RepID=A0A1H8TBD2_9ACTN|nr:hypothetical protein [Actinacidiphila rubida]SEO88449.1 hypothetical protein SAMN05216267_10513 [Actinacidiphila rubida]
MTTPHAGDDAHDMDQQNSPDFPHPDGPLAGEAADEAVLRALMHDAVRGLPATPDALDYLRRAVPVRRQRRRQALVGAAAALILVGAAVPALVRAAGTTDGSSATAASVTDSRTSSPGADGHTLPGGGSDDPSGHAPPGIGGDPSTQHTTAGDTPSTPPSTVVGTGGPAPDCSSTQLGQGASSAGSPDADGRVYGWFRVSNVSDTPCTVPSGGVVQAVAQGSADPSRIQVLDHTAGDAASGLPAPGAAGPLVLRPGQDYEVAFAWVPDSGGTGGCATPTTPPTTPTPTPTDTGTTGTAADPASGSAAGSGPAAGNGSSGGSTTPDSPAPASVALNHTPAAGAPVVNGPVIADACAGTVYTTAPLPAPTSTSAS